MKQGQELPQFSTDPQEVVSTVMDIFDQGIKALQEIPQLEPILLKHLFLKAHGNKSLKAPMIPHSKPEVPDKKHILPDENTWLWNCYSNILSTLSKGIEPLRQYLKTYEKFKHESQLNPEKYVRALDDYENPATVEEIKADIEKHRKESKRILSEIPDHIVVSYFKVNCKDIRKLFCSRHESIVDKDIKLIAQRARDRNNALALRFEEMESKIRKVPNTIEELQDIKDYMAALPIEIEQHKFEIKECMQVYDMLEDFQFDFPMTELDSKWELFAAPKKLMECIQGQTGILEKQKEVFLKEMAQEQEDFEEMLDGIEMTVGSFSQYTDPLKYESTYEDVKSVNQRLKEFTEKTNLFNKREAIMGKPMTNYARLRQAVKDFEPYSNLWTTVRNWHHCYRSWMEDPWEQLDAINLEDTVQNSFKTILRTTAYFKSKEMPKIQSISENMKDTIDGFRKYVPLAVALRKEGMYTRHWDDISKGVKFDIRPVEGFTLTTVISKGLEAFVPL
jgi:dynein heavy chain